MDSALDVMSWLDFAALGLLLGCWGGFGLLLRHGPVSTGAIMSGWREEWFQRCVERDNRIIDSQLLISMRSGVAFLASACLAAIGGAVALLGQVEQVESVAEAVSGEFLAPEAMLAMKLLLVILILAQAVLRFLWSHRVFGYCSVMLGAIPNEAGPRALEVAARAARLNIQAAKSFNSGLRAIYVALAALAWLLGPVALILATAATFAILVRREYFSTTRAIVSAPR